MKEKTIDRISSFLRARRLSLWLSCSALLFFVFVRITRELIEGDVGAFDNSILLAVANVRTPWLTAAAVDVTALGSITLLALFSAFTLLILLILRDRKGALQLVAALAGGSLLTVVAKDMIERSRPEDINRLIVVSGFSYPSGHSVSSSALYLTIAIVAGRHVRNARVRTAIFIASGVVLTLVGMSRLYLGVHYATDVASGLSVGAAWALLLAGLFAPTARRVSS